MRVLLLSAALLPLVSVSVAGAAAAAPPDIPGGPGTKANLALGSRLGSDIGFARDADWFRAYLQAGRLYAFTALTTVGGEGVRFRLSVKGPAGRVFAAADLLAGGDGESTQLNFRPEAAGTYYLEIKLAQAQPTEPGFSIPYQVGLFRDNSLSFADAARLPFNTQVAGRMESNADTDYYVVRLEKGKAIDLLFPSITPQDSVVLLDRERQPLGIVDLNFGKLAYYVPTYTGDHLVSVNLPFGIYYTLKVAPADRGRPTQGDDLLIGTDGPDVIDALGGSDQVRGLAGDDILRGGPGENTIFGGAGNDRVKGGETFDLLFGEDGNDVLIGGLGVDYLHGGPGADRFVFAGDTTRGYDSGSRSNPDPYRQELDRVYDFAAGDKIDLRGVDADAIRAGRQAFTFVGTAPFSGPGQVRYLFYLEDLVSPRTVVALNTDADAEPEMEIRLENRFALRATDFTLRDPPRRRR